MLPSPPQTAAAPRTDERRRRPREPAELERVFPLAEVGEACHAGGAGGGGGGRQAWASNAAPNTLGQAAAQATSARTWGPRGSQLVRKRDFFCALRKCEGVRAGRLGAAGGRQQLGAARSKIFISQPGF